MRRTKEPSSTITVTPGAAVEREEEARSEAPDGRVGVALVSGERPTAGARPDRSGTAARRSDPATAVTVDAADQPPLGGALGTDATLDASAAEPRKGAVRVRAHPRDAATLSADGAALLDPNMGLVEADSAPIASERPVLPASLKERFESVEFLGEGGMGAVYRARDKRLGRDVALKFLFGGGAETSQRLLREARSQARLEHENACKVYEVGVVEGHRYIVMQLIEGEALDKANPRMTLEEKVRVVRQVASALHEAHRLGLVHRDIKPSNIMVEQGEDGAYKPYLMDFGLAREVGDHGHTVTGGIVGTPMFMAPEQALGETRSLDRRTDVYSLGATLYDVLSGRPPFVDESIFRLLERVAREEPAPLRRAMPEVPEDIDAIVMKCLEKEPGRRYESARALGDELQRFLDGEPVQARRASLTYVVLKKLKRHKGKVALAGALLLAALVVVVAWAREQRLASTRARISRELGEDVKEMELFLRNAYSLPTHDIERERAIVRARLKSVEARMAAAGPAGEGPGHYALGRGYAALKEPEAALSHLTKASLAGYAPPELDYAMGLLLSELYKNALEETKRIESAEKRKERVAAIEATYKEPALRHLRAALGARLDAPAYVEGIIALHEGRHDEARALAGEAFERAPWLYEAKELEGDALFAEGSKFRHDAAFDYDKMMGLFDRASAAYREASAIARSNPKIYEAECELWIQVMYASHVRPESLTSSFEKAKRACEDAVASSPRAGSARIKTAFAYQAFVWQMQSWRPGGEDLERTIEDAIARAEEAARASPEDPMAHYVAATARRTMVHHLLDRGLDSGASLERAVASYERAIKLDPAFLWAHNELCATHAAGELSESWRGIDPEATVKRAVERCDRAIEIDPSFTYPYVNKAIAYYRLARHLAEMGSSPEPAFAAALEASAAAKAQSPDVPNASNLSAWVEILKASFESDSGLDPSASLARAEQSVKDVERIAPSAMASYELRGTLAFTRGLDKLRRGEDPGPLVEEARRGFQRLVDEAPWDADFRILRAQAEILSVRWELREGTVEEAALDAAMRPLLPLLDRERARPHIYETAAEIHELQAAWLLAKRKDPEEVITKGLEVVEKALALNPRLPSALATKGGLYLVRARAITRSQDARLDAARQAKEALAAALSVNPRLARDRRAALEEVERMLAVPARVAP